MFKTLLCPLKEFLYTNNQCHPKTKCLFIWNVLSSLLSAKGKLLLDEAGPDMLRDCEVRLPRNISVVVPSSGKGCSVEGHWDCRGKEEQASQNNNSEQKSCHFGGWRRTELWKLKLPFIERREQLPLAGLSSPATSLAAPRYRFLVNTGKEEKTSRKQVACSINWEIGRGCCLVHSLQSLFGGALLRHSLVLSLISIALKYL